MGYENYKTRNETKKLLTISNTLTAEDLTKPEQAVMKEYYTFLQGQGLKITSITDYIVLLHHLLRELKNPLKPTKKGIGKYLISLARYSKRSMQEKKKFLIKFYKWYTGKEQAKIPFLKDVKIQNTVKYKLPEEMLTPEDITKLTQCCTNFRDKAVIMTLYESGARRGEFLQLKIKDVRIIEDGDKTYGYLSIPEGKTVPRKVALMYSIPHLINWLNSHPNRDDPEAPLFITLGTWHGRAFGDSTLAYLLETLKARSGITKKIYPHIFRHSRISQLAGKLTDQELKLVGGWEKGSQMTSHYTHKTDVDVADKLLSFDGFKAIKTSDTEEILRQKTCPFCEALNPTENKFCQSCSRCMDLKTANEEIKSYRSMQERMNNMETAQDQFNNLFQQMMLQNATFPKEPSAAEEKKLLKETREMQESYQNQKNNDETIKRII